MRTSVSKYKLNTTKSVIPLVLNMTPTITASRTGNFIQHATNNNVPILTKIENVNIEPITHKGCQLIVKMSVLRPLAVR